MITHEAAGGLIGPTPKEVKDANAGKLAPHGLETFLRKLTRSWAVKLGLASAAGIGAYEYVPAVHEFVDSQYHNLLQTIGQETAPVLSTFDNKKDKQMIGDSNILRITPEDADKQDLLTPQFNPEANTVTILSPLALPQGVTALIDKTPYAVRGIEHQDERNTVPVNAEIVFPKGARVTLIRGAADQGKDPNLAYSVSFSWYDEKNDVTIGWGFSSSNGLKTDLPLQNQPIKGVSEINVEKLPISDGKTPIAITTTADSFYTAGTIYAGKNISPENYRGKIKTLNYKTQNGKLLILEPSL